MTCPSCGGRIVNSDIFDEYCTKCGLLLHTYNEETFNKPKKRKKKKGSKPIIIEKKCLICRTKENITRHHIIPKRNGKNDSPDNIALLCRNCHNIADKVCEMIYPVLTIKELK